MSHPIPESTLPWLRGVHAALGLSEADHQRCVAQSAVVLGDVPILWTRTLTGDDSQLMAQALIGPVGTTEQAAPVLEAVLHTQLMLCGPAMPVFGFDTGSRSLMLMQVFSTQRDSAEAAVALLRAMQRITLDTREVLTAV
ncbi:hypothetical protein [Roseateles amylovorans]|jgi:hypothetical protein|uniref:Uncharacterized protein n=1 Tax=Roseateles amylovorans TaxID=2978473 RepID=A0ABY6AYL4_9BURK|nr:hypothetical protein [Roseateles amylovorans]UXH78271.1 hypothetical protein N4261_25540 [Roseateles amylovorans]